MHNTNRKVFFNIYSCIKIESKGKINSITYTTVYPNGNLSKEVSEDLGWEDKNSFNASKKTVTLQKPDGEASLDLLGFNSFACANGKKGYLEKLEVSGGVVTKILAKVSLETEKYLDKLIK